MVLTPFTHLVGQAQAVELLSAAIHRDRVAPAYLFTGPQGVGRRRAAQAFLEALLCPPSPDQQRQLHCLRRGNHPDALWLEPTYQHQGKLLTRTQLAAAGAQLPKSRPQIRLEQIREIARFVGRPPLMADRTVVVLTEAETMAEAAANGLLKTLEEPGQATLILIAPGPDALLPTLVSRCQPIPFHRLSEEQMALVLAQAGKAGILQHPQILAMAQGSPGAAIQHWQQLQTVSPELLQTVTQPLASLRQALGLARRIDEALDLEAQLWLIDYLQHHRWQQGQSHHLQILEQARRPLLSYAQPRLVWEVTLMELVSSGPLPLRQGS